LDVGWILVSGSAVNRIDLNSPLARRGLGLDLRSPQYFPILQPSLETMAGFSSSVVPQSTMN